MRTGRNVVGNVGDMHAEKVAFFRFFNGNSVVDIPRVRAVDRNDQFIPKIVATL